MLRRTFTPNSVSHRLQKTVDLQFPHFHIEPSIELITLQKGTKITHEFFGGRDVLIFIVSGTANLTLGSSKFLINKNYVALCPTPVSFCISPFKDSLSVLFFVPSSQIPSTTSRTFGVKIANDVSRKYDGFSVVRNLSGFYPISGFNVDFCSLATEKIINNLIPAHYFFLTSDKIAGTEEITFGKSFGSYCFLGENISMDLSNLKNSVDFLRIQILGE